MKIVIQLILALWILAVMVFGISQIVTKPFDSLASDDLIFLLVCSSICFSVTRSGRGENG